MIIHIDTRETKPLEFPYLCVDGTKRIKLDVGDYGVEFTDGYKPPIFFERKSMGDLFGTLGKGYKRFKKEIMRSQEAKCSLILIVEGSLSKVMKGYSHSTIEGLSIVRKLFTLYVKYGVRPVFCKSREEMSLYIYNMFYALGVQHVRKK